MISLAQKFSVRSVPATGQALPYPIVPSPPMAVFSPHFASATPHLLFPDAHELAHAGVQSVAGSLNDLLEIDSSVWKPEFPIVVLSCLTRGLLTDEDRDDLWEQFRVPVFECLIDTRGRVVAEECEAHDGLHLRRTLNETVGKIAREECECGKTSPRLLTLDAIIEESSLASTLKQEWRNWQTHQT